MSDRALAFVHRSVWFYEARDYAKAEAAARRALMINPGLAPAHEARGIALMHMKRFTDAEVELRRAIAIKPPGAAARYCLGLLLRDTDRLEESEREFRGLLDLDLSVKPSRADVSVALGTLLLSQGRYDEGWRHYEARHPPEEIRIGSASDEPLRDGGRGAVPRWAGEDLAGKAILLWPEQGFGDVIQFARYAPLLAKRGARVTMAISRSLRDLLSTLPNVNFVIVGEPVRNLEFDYWIQLASVPRFLPPDAAPAADVPYLRADAARLEKWRHRLPDGLRIGLTWKGSAAHPNDAERSLEFELLQPLWRATSASFISLQKGRDEAIRAPTDQPMVQLGAEIEDFADLAAIVSQLDLVISVDTAVAHVVGALARPGWILLPRFQPDWRWLLAGEQSPWYPSLRLFRQERDFSWTRPIEALAAALSAYCR